MPNVVYNHSIDVVESEHLHYEPHSLPHIPKELLPYPGQEGLASWYRSGHTTASLERYDTRKETAAHRSLPFNTIVEITNLENDKTAVVRINDRGPYYDKENRIIDVTPKVADMLGFKKEGLTKVRIKQIELEQQ